MGDRLFGKKVFGVIMSLFSFSTTSCGDAVKNLVILLEFLLLLQQSPLFFPIRAAPPSCVLLPPLVDPVAPAPLRWVLWMYPSMLRWTFGVLYVAIAVRLPRLSLLNFLFLELVVDCCVGGVGGVGDCQNDSIVGWFDGSGDPLHCCWACSTCASSSCSISLIAAARSVHSSDTASASVFDTSLSAFLRNTRVFSDMFVSVFA